VANATPSRESEETALAGIAAIVFGLAVLVWTHQTVGILVILFVSYALVTGALALIASRQQAKAHRSWWASAVKGAGGIAAALALLVWPSSTFTVITYIIAAWAVITALAELADALTTGDWLAAAIGGVLLIAAFLLLLSGTSLGSAVPIIGIGAIVWGGLTLTRAFVSPTI
jgi:uncharacterized membrane protein HdeD (DUF308 family)